MTSSLNRGTTATCLFLAGALATAPLCAQRDTILRVDGKHKTKVQITKLERDQFTYKSSGKEMTIKTTLVTGYRFGTAPDEYVRGMSAANRGSHAAAAKLFVEAVGKTKEAAIKTTATFYAGKSFALASLEDPTHANNAVAQLQSYLAAEASGYYVPEAKVRLAQASLAGSDAAGAETMLTGLETEATSGAWDLYWPALIQFTKAKAQYTQDKFADARMTFQAVDGAVTAALGQSSKYNSRLANLRTQALVLQGETYIGQKMYDDALGYYQTLASNNTRGVKAAAKAGEGQILYIQGADKGDEQKLRQAQLALASACIEPDTNVSTSAKALYYMGKVLTALGDKEQNALGRAKTYFQSVRKNYGTTEWAARARKELEG